MPLKEGLALMIEDFAQRLGKHITISAHLHYVELGINGIITPTFDH